MKIAVITRHAITNYGSLLQTYATQKVLQNMGHEVAIIDYIRNDEDYSTITKVLLKKSPKWNSNPIMRAIYYTIQSPEYILMGKKFEKLRKKNLLLTKTKFNNLDQLTREKPIADIYCTGSDQVWGPIGYELYDPAYFLAFTGPEDKCISYAASFGKTVFDEKTKAAYSELLKKYITLTVREKSAFEIVRYMGFGDVRQVLDPTLLLTCEEWNSLIKKEILTKYVLIYQLHTNLKMDQYAKDFAKKVGLPLIRITPTPHHIVRGGKPVLLPDLGIFLSYIKNAEYMITDSFHGTAFAINFNTQFIDINPGLTATRNLSILELTGLTNRMLTSYDDFSFLSQKIDFAPVNERIKMERLRSLQWLSSTLDGMRK